MSSGSPAQHGSGRPTARHSYRDEAISGPDPYGSGPRSDPQQAQAGRHGAPFGPDVSWPNGFQQLDPKSRQLLESGYGSSSYGRAPYDYGDTGYSTGAHAAAGYDRGSGYQQPAMNDLGYGDPGYSDPAYEGPRSPGSGLPGGTAPAGYGGPSGYHDAGTRQPAYPEPGYQQYAAPLGGSDQVYPTTGAQQALPATGPQPVSESWAARDAGQPGTGSQAYPEQWYGNPRMNDSLDSGPRPDGPPAADPRLAGMRYDQLRYEDDSLGGPGYDEPPDDESWYEELRRGGPAQPRHAADQPGLDQRPADPQPRPDPRVPGYGQPGYGDQPGYSPAPAYEQPYGYGQAQDLRTGLGPRMGTAREAGTGSWPGAMSGPGDAQPLGPVFPQDQALQGAGYLSAPTAHVGVLTPPPAQRLDDLTTGGPVLAGPSSGQLLAPPVRPGHGLDGPEITSSWPAHPPAPSADEADSFDEFWREDDKDGDRPGLFPSGDDDLDDGHGTGARGGRRVGRRRGRSNDHRLWLALGGVIVVAAAAIFAIIKFEFPAQSGPTHAMVIPAKIGTYVRTVDLERQTNVAELRSEVIKMSGGKATDVVSAVYESGNSAAGNTEQIIMLIEGHLADAAPAASIASFTQKFPGATVVNAGALGGKAACVEAGAGTSNPKSLCVWFDNDSFGEIVSPTMNATELASVMRTVRPSVELVTKN
jgi:hypothetical protein